MTSAAAKIALERLFYVVVARLRILFQERRSGHDHAIRAVRALRSLLVDEGLLERVESIGLAEALERGDRLVTYVRNGCHACADRRIAQMDGACSTLRQSTSKLRPVELQVISEDVQQRRVGRDINNVLLSVHRQCEGHWRVLPEAYA